MRHLVITVHGIRTYGHWQERLERLLWEASEDIEVKHFKYSYFPSIRLLGPYVLGKEVRRFREDLNRYIDSAEFDRIDLVGHSFGTYLIGKALESLATRTSSSRPLIQDRKSTRLTSVT